MATIATTRAMSFVLFLSLILIIFEGGQSVQAQGPAPAPATSAAAGPAASGPAAAAPDCLTLLLGMADCLTYVETGSNLTKPEKPCCGELKTLVDTNPVCLCELLANSSSSGFDIDIHRATQLPSICKVDTPPVNTCALLGYPVGGPTEGPTSADGPSGGALPSAGSSTAPSPSANNGVRDNGVRVSGISVTYIGALIVGFATVIF